MDGLICKTIGFTERTQPGCWTRYTYGKQRFRGSSVLALFAVQQGGRGHRFWQRGRRLDVRPRFVCSFVAYPARSILPNNKIRQFSVCLSFTRDEYFPVLVLAPGGEIRFIRWWIFSSMILVLVILGNSNR